MDYSESLFDALGLPDGGYAEIDPAVWIVEPGREPTAEAEDAQLELHFEETPVASALAASLQELDREARRVAQAITERVAPVEVIGRESVPPEDGLVVRGAEPGSLTLLIVLGEIYRVVASQPVSFGLNLAAMLGYGRAVLRVFKRGGGRREGELRVPAARPHEQDRYGGGVPTVRIPGPTGPIEVPQGLGHVKFRVRYPDGTEVELEIRPG